MKNILVTGGCGFIGGNFVRYLLNHPGFDGNLINIDKLTYAGNRESLTDIEQRFPDRYTFIHGDICDQNLIARIFREQQIDTIIHFAAESHVDRSISDPYQFLQTNLLGTYVLLEVARQNSGTFKLFHHVSTDEVFGSLGNEGFFTEETAYHPNNPYSATKAGSDHLVRAYHNTYDLPITVSNCSNNYGPYQFPEKLIPLTILNALAGKPIPIYGKGENTRDWLFVEDHCSAIWTIIEKAERGTTYNVGGHNDITNLAIVQTICSILDEIRPGKKPYQELITFVEDRPGHDWRYAIDASKIEKELGWKPTESFDTGIRKTVEWYLSHEQWTKNIQSGDYLNWINQHYYSNQEPCPVPIRKDQRS